MVVAILAMQSVFSSAESKAFPSSYDNLGIRIKMTDGCNHCFLPQRGLSRRF